MMRRPGDSRMERLATCAACLFGKGTDLTNLSNSCQNSIASHNQKRSSAIPTKRIDKNQLCQDHSCSLEVDSLPGIIAKVLYD